MIVESGRRRGSFTWRWFGLRFGFEHSPIYHRDSLYMDRWILYLFSCTLRLHKIMRPDHDRALHNHPFWFVTFPLRGYTEIFGIPPDGVPQWLRDRVGDDGWVDATRRVRAFRFQFRGLAYRHRIIALEGGGPVWTIVFSGPYQQQWGFFPTPTEFVPWKNTSAEEPLK